MLSSMEWLTAAGLGLDYEALRLERTTQRWLDAGSELRRQVADQLHDISARVEQIGSSSVPGLLAKPIIDLAVGLDVGRHLSEVTARLESAGWIYRGDAGANGGHVFVLEARPWHRVAHAHVVDDGGEQWLNYLRLRDHLLHSADARAQYETAKLRVVGEAANRKEYQEGKAEAVALLLRDAG